MINKVYAASITPGGLGLPGGFSDIGDIVGVILPAAITTAGLAALAFLIFGGFTYLTAAGDEKNMDKARKTISGAVIGLVIVTFAYLIIKILETVLGISITT